MVRFWNMQRSRHLAPHGQNRLSCHYDSKVLVRGEMPQGHATPATTQHAAAAGSSTAVHILYMTQLLEIPPQKGAYSNPERSEHKAQKGEEN